MKNRSKGAGSRGLLSLCLIASLVGLALIWSATRYDPALHSAVGKQAAALGLGVVLCLLLPLVDLRAVLSRLWWLFLGGNIALLLLLIPLGNDDGTGNKSWISLPGGVFNFQPAEFVKLSFLLLLALQLERRRERGLNKFGSILLLAGHVLALCALLYGVSGDIGMVAVYLGIYLVMLWSAGVHPLWLLAQIGVGAGAAVLLWPRLPDYIRLRFLVVLDHQLDPLGKGFQQGRSLLAIGSGRLAGQGYLQGTQTQSLSPSALPARHTDFIFSVAGEELGLIGCGVILLLLAAIVLSCAHLGRTADEPFFQNVSMGVAGMLGVQTILNVGMCLYAVPVVGVTLPFFSYGGSSIVSAFLGIGVLRSLCRRTAKNGKRPGV